MTDIYTSGNYLKNNPTWHAEHSAWKAEHIFKMLRKNDLKVDSICEVGCGAGGILEELHKKMPEHVVFHGYEISSQAYDLCTQKKKERLDYYLGDMRAINSSRYDLLLLIDVLEHIQDYFIFLKELKERGTYKIFHIPLDISVQSVLRDSFLKGREVCGHLHYFTKGTALATLRDAGYEIVDYKITRGAIEMAGKTFKSRMKKYLCKMLYCLNRELAARILGGFSIMVLAK